MIHDWRNDHDGALPHGRLYDADTGEEVDNVFWWDTETGDYEYFVMNDKGLAHLDPVTDELVTARGNRRLRFEPFDGEPNLPTVVGASLEGRGP